MERISMRLINAILIVGYVLLSLLHIEPVETIRQYVGILLAGWAILHTEKLRGTGNWRLEFVELPPDFIKLCHYAATLYLAGAVLYYWFFPMAQFQTVAARIMLISLGLAFVKIGVTPAEKGSY